VDISVQTDLDLYQQIYNSAIQTSDQYAQLYLQAMEELEKQSTHNNKFDMLAAEIENLKHIINAVEKARSEAKEEVQRLNKTLTDDTASMTQIIEDLEKELSQKGALESGLGGTFCSF
jgi:hypothetical protein